MKITWLGHACFRIEHGDCSLIIDPYRDGSVPGLSSLRERANGVLCSHEHGDHAGRETVQVTGGAEAISVEVLDTFHDDAGGSLRGPNKIFLLSDGTHRAAHLGDLGCRPSPEQLETLKGLDALMIPVGGFYTIGGALAAELVKELQPRMVIPMHYRTESFGFDVISTAADFTSRMDTVAILPGSQVDTAETYPAQVLVVEPKNKM